LKGDEVLADIGFGDRGEGEGENDVLGGFDEESQSLQTV